MIEPKRKEGSFIDVLRNFLDREKIDYELKDNAIVITIYGRDILFMEDIKECRIIKKYVPDMAEMIRTESEIWRYVPSTKREIMKLTKFKGSRNLEITTEITMYEPPLERKVVSSGTIFEKTFVKNILKESSKTDETFHIICRCDSTGLKCEYPMY